MVIMGESQFQNVNGKLGTRVSLSLYPIGAILNRCTDVLRVKYRILVFFNLSYSKRKCVSS
jgi:hypothetical protein